MEELISKVDKYCKKNLSQKRYDHSVRVAQLCSEICAIFGMDERKGYLCGIAHDICKEIPKDKMVEMCREGGYEISDYELKNPTLLHGKAGRLRLIEKFNIDDKDVLRAVEAHVCGDKDMGDYGKVLYVADKSERGRPHVTEEYLQKLFAMPLNHMMKLVVGDTLEHIKKMGYIVYPETELMYNSL